MNRLALNVLNVLSVPRVLTQLRVSAHQSINLPASTPFLKAFLRCTFGEVEAFTVITDIGSLLTAFFFGQLVVGGRGFGTQQKQQLYQLRIHKANFVLL